MEFQFDAVDAGYVAPTAADLTATLRQMNAIVRLNEQAMQNTSTETQESDEILAGLNRLIGRAEQLLR